MKKKLLLHDMCYAIGGPNAVLRGIEESYLGEKYTIERLKQPDACGFNPFKALMFIWHYRKEINKHNADAIYICGLQYVGLLMTIAAKLSNVKRVVLSVHGSNWDNPDGTLRKWVLMHIIEPWECRLADRVFTVCDAAQKTIGALKHAKKGCNGGVVYNTFPTPYTPCEKHIRKEFGIAEDKILVVMVGRVVKAKGHDYVIEAIKQFADDNYVYMVVGEGDYVDVYKKECAREIEDCRVILTGNRKDVNDILAESDIFLFATLNENHSIALLEAVNMKCCALCTNVGGNGEIIRDRHSGILIPSKDSSAIVSGLKELKDESLRKQYADVAFKEDTEKFSIENTYGHLEKILFE